MAKEETRKEGKEELKEPLSASLNTAITGCKKLQSTLDADLATMEAIIEQSNERRNANDRSWADLKQKGQLPRPSNFRSMKRLSRKLVSAEKKRRLSDVNTLLKKIVNFNITKLATPHVWLAAQVEKKTLCIMAMLSEDGQRRPGFEDLNEDRRTFMRLMQKSVHGLRRCTLVLKRFKKNVGDEDQ